MLRAPGHVARAVAVCATFGGAVLVDEHAAVPAVAPGPTQIWRVDGEGRGRPAADSSTAYYLSKRHEVLALDAASGIVRWRQSTGEEGTAPLGSAVLLAGPVVVAGDYDVMAFDHASGAPRWRFSPTDGYGPGMYLGSAAEGLVFTGSPAGRAYAIDAGTGARRWSAPVADDGRTTVFQPVADGALVVAGYTTFAAPSVGGVVAFELSTGRERWRASFPNSADPSLGTGWAGGPLMAGDLVIAASGDGRIYALGRDDGAMRWSLPAVSANCAAGVGSPNRDFRPLARSRRTLFAGSLTGCVTAYDLGTRRELWRYSSTEEGSTAFGLVSNGEAVYVPYAAGFLLALSIADGTLRWRIGGGDAGFRWPPTLVGDRAYVAASTGFFAFHQ